MHSVQFGFVVPVETSDRARRASWMADVSRALDLVAGHFDSAWVVDHLQFGNMDVLEGFTTLTWLAARYPQLRFGNAVLCQSFRNPALLAKMTATLQFLSDGRFILGLGAGWHQEEYDAYGYDFPPAGVRVQQLAETIQIIRSLWTEEQVTFQGQHYQVSSAFCEPKPDPLPPLMVGAFGPKMLRLTATYADWWNVSSTSPARYRPMAQTFNQACQELGRDPTAVQRSWIGGCACAPSEEEAIAFTEGRWSADNEEDFGFVGTPAQLIDQMQPFLDQGVDCFMFDCGGFPNLTTLEMLVNEVLPAVAGRKAFHG